MPFTAALCKQNQQVSPSSAVSQPVSPSSLTLERPSSLLFSSVTVIPLMISLKGTGSREWRRHERTQQQGEGVPGESSMPAALDSSRARGSSTPGH